MPTLADLRTKLPALDGLDDENAIAFIQERYYPDQPIAKIADALGYKPPPAPVPPASLFDRVKDTGVGLAQGFVGLGQGVVGLADLASGGAAGKALEDSGVNLNDANQWWNDRLSPQQQAVNAKVAGAFKPQEGDNAVDPYLRGAGAAITNPSSIWQAIAQSAPSMLGGGIIGRGAAALAPKLGAWASGIGEGVVTAGQQAEQIRTDELNPSRDMTGTQSLYAAGSGALTGAIGGAIGRLAQRLGFETAENLMTGIHADPVKTISYARKLVGGGLSEGTQEFLQSAQEQMAQNVAVGADPWKDVPQNAVMGALAGVGMGLGSNLTPHSRRHAAADPEDAIDPNTPAAAKAARDQAMRDIGRAGSVDEAVDAFKRTQLPPAPPLGRIDGDAAMRRLAIDGPGGTGFDEERGGQSIINPITGENVYPNDPRFEDIQRLKGEDPNRKPPPPPPGGGTPTMDPETGQLVPPPPFGERLESLRAQLEDSRTRQHIRETAGPEALNDILHYAQAADNPNLPGKTSDAMLARAEAILAQAQGTPVPGAITPESGGATGAAPISSTTSTPVASATPGKVSTPSTENRTSPVSTPIAPTVPRQGAFQSEAEVLQHLRTSQRPLDADRQEPTAPQRFADGSWGYTTDKTIVEAYKNRSLKERADSMARGEPQPEPAPRGSEQLPEPMEGKNGMKAVFSHSTSKPGQIHVSLFDSDSGNAVGHKIVGSVARAKFEAEKFLGIRKPEEKFFEPRANLARAGVELAPAPAPAGDEKARWLKAVADANRLIGPTGPQISGTKDGRLHFLGDPNSSKAGKALLANTEEARKAGATNEEIAAAAATPAPKPAPAPAPAAERRQKPGSIFDRLAAEGAAQKKRLGDADLEREQAQPPAEKQAASPESAPQISDNQALADSLKPILEEWQAAAKAEKERWDKEKVKPKDRKTRLNQNEFYFVEMAKANIARGEVDKGIDELRHMVGYGDTPGNWAGTLGKSIEAWLDAHGYPPLATSEQQHANHEAKYRERSLRERADRMKARSKEKPVDEADAAATAKEIRGQLRIADKFIDALQGGHDVSNGEPATPERMKAMLADLGKIVGEMGAETAHFEERYGPKAKQEFVKQFQPHMGVVIRAHAALATEGETNAPGQERQQGQREQEHRDGDRGGQTSEAGGGDRAVDHGQGQGEGASGAQAETPQQVAARVKRFGSYAHDDAIDDKLRARVLDALKTRPDTYRVHNNGPDDTRIHLGIEPLRSYGNDGQIILKDDGTARLSGDDDVGWASTMSVASVKRTLQKYLKKVDATPAPASERGPDDVPAIGDVVSVRFESKTAKDKERFPRGYESIGVVDKVEGDQATVKLNNGKTITVGPDRIGSNSGPRAEKKPSLKERADKVKARNKAPEIEARFAPGVRVESNDGTRGTVESNLSTGVTMVKWDGAERSTAYPTDQLQAHKTAADMTPAERERAFREYDEASAKGPTAAEVQAAISGSTPETADEDRKLRASFAEKDMEGYIAKRLDWTLSRERGGATSIERLANNIGDPRDGHEGTTVPRDAFDKALESEIARGRVERTSKLAVRLNPDLYVEFQQRAAKPGDAKPAKPVGADAIDFTLSKELGIDRGVIADALYTGHYTPEQVRAIVEADPDNAVENLKDAGALPYPKNAQGYKDQLHAKTMVAALLGLDKPPSAPTIADPNGLEQKAKGNPHEWAGRAAFEARHRRLAPQELSNEKNRAAWYRGYDAAKAEVVEAEIVQRDTKKAAARARARMALDPENDTLLQALAKLGGIRRDVVASEFGLKGEEQRFTVPVGGLKGFPFRASGGMELDRAIEALAEAGYFRGVPEEDQRSTFEQAIYDEIGGHPTYTAEGNMRRGAEGEQQRQKDRAETEQMLEPPALDQAEIDKLLDEAGLAESDISDDDIDFMLSSAEQEDILSGDALDETQAGQDAGDETGAAGLAPSDQARPAPAERKAAGAPTRTPEQRAVDTGDDAEALASYTPEELRQRDAERSAAAAKDAAEQKRLADKAKADAERGDFTLTGSDRAADVGAAGGQTGMFDQLPAEAAGKVTGRQWTASGEKPFRSYTLTVGDKVVAVVKHAGHPTAIRPYYLLGPLIDHAPIDIALRKFDTLDKAKAAVEGLLDNPPKGEGPALWREQLAEVEKEIIEAAPKALKGDIEKATYHRQVPKALAMTRGELLRRLGDTPNEERLRQMRNSLVDSAATELAAEQAVLALDEAAIEALAGRTVEIPVQVGDSGKTATMKMDAAEAVRDIQKRAKAADELLRCVS